MRLTGCHVRCAWCDSAHAFNGGEPLAVDAVLARVREQGLRTVLVTGGEPLLQPAVVDLLRALLADGREVLLETSGTVGPRTLVPLAAVPVGVHRIVDLKAPGSGLDPGVIDWAGIARPGCRRRTEGRAGRPARLRVGARPGARGGAAAAPACRSASRRFRTGCRRRTWRSGSSSDGLDVRFQLQLHKIVWPGVERGV